jgi:hypothetical protein
MQNDIQIIITFIFLSKLMIIPYLISIFPDYESGIKHSE